MIKIFSGEVRGVGVQSGQDAWMQLGFSFRTIMHHFKGARLGVFMCIVLHANENYYSFPSYEMIEAETGYSNRAIADALDELCAMNIDGQRVLLKINRTRDGKRTSNLYKIFPTREELRDQDDAAPCEESSHGETENRELSEESTHGQAQSKCTNYLPSIVKSSLKPEPVFNNNQGLTKTIGGSEKNFSTPPDLGTFTGTLDQLWEVILAQLKPDIDRTIYSLHLSRNQVAGIVTTPEGSRCLMIQCISQAAREWCTTHIEQYATRTLRSVTGDALTSVVFIYEE